MLPRATLPMDYLSADSVRERECSGVVSPMEKIPTVSAVTLPAFIKGQFWKFGEHCVRIEHVGKILVEHRGVSLERHRNVTPKRMTAIKELQKFLKTNCAVLMTEQPLISKHPAPSNFASTRAV
jgi:hypothetical protein